MVNPFSDWKTWWDEKLPRIEQLALDAVAKRFLTVGQPLSVQQFLVGHPPAEYPALQEAFDNLVLWSLVVRSSDRNRVAITPLGLFKCEERQSILEDLTSFRTALANIIRENPEVSHVTTDMLRNAGYNIDGSLRRLGNIVEAFRLVETGGWNGTNVNWLVPSDPAEIIAATTFERLARRAMPELAKPVVVTPPTESQRSDTPDVGLDGWVKGKSLGQGGQGTAFRVYRRRDGIEGAKKELHQPNGADPEEWQQAKARAVREIEVLKGITHPCVLKVIDSGVDGDTPWMITEYQPLGSLHDAKDVLKGDAWRVLRLARDVAVALSVVHAKNVIHRDVKPKNILLRSLDHAVLGDFGIAHVGDGTQLTATAEKVAARWFGPPEAEHGRLDDPVPSFDVFSLGKVIYWTLTGGREFRRERFREGDANLLKVLDRPSLEPVNVLLGRMIVEEPAGRFQTMDEVVRAIDETLATLFGGRRSEEDCEVCGVGRVSATGSVSWTFSDGQTTTEPIVYFCDECGHVRFHSRPFLEERVGKQDEKKS